MAEDPYRYFRIEARELLDQIGSGALELEKGRGSPELVSRLLRHAHTLKGAARVVRQHEVAEHAHELEDALAPLVDAPERALARETIDALLARVDAMARLVDALDQPASEPVPDAPAPAEPSRAPRVVRADAGELDVVLAGIGRAHARASSLVELARNAGDAARTAAVLRGQLAGPGAGGARDIAAALAGDLRASLTRLESRLVELAERTERDLRDVQERAVRLRLVPVHSVFDALERTARDVAAAVGRRVSFVGRGGAIRVEAHLLDTAQGALLQLVRNAVAHGIETPAERRTAGKSPEGLVEVEAELRADRVLFRCRDDGKGLDLAAVREVARRRGRLDAAKPCSDDELVQLLLRGGLSTSNEVSVVAGRGVGLDVVRAAAESLGGSVRLRTESRRGTTVEIDVPASQAARRILVVEAAGVRIGIPLENVRRAARLRSDAVVRTAQGETTVIDGQVVPIVRLAALFAGEAVASDPQTASAIFLDSPAGAFAVLVERVLGAATVVLRPPPELAGASPLVAGCWADLDGKVQLVLEPRELLREVGAGPGPLSQARPLPVLVVDDSLTTRMVERTVLESAGYDVDVAASGEEAFERAREKRYALFLVDVEMPGMDGYTFVERARVEPTTRGVPAILVTSRSSPEDRQRGSDAGAAGFIAKGEFDQAVLLERIRELLSAASGDSA